jgi:hypothetical protein
MPNLIQSIQNRDIGFLRIVALLWGIELGSTKFDAAINELSTVLLDSTLANEIVEALPTPSRTALEALVKGNGKLPWATFCRSFGEIRDVGPGRRDREKVYLHPVTPAEELFYRALLARAFFDTSSGAQEFAYIPDDILNLIHLKGHISQDGEMNEPSKTFAPMTNNHSDEPLGRPALPMERQYLIPACDRLLDDATTLLAALRMGISPPETRVPVQVVMEFLCAARIIVEGRPRVEQVRSFLEAPRLKALEKLLKSWVESETFNELRLVPGIVCEGEWSNQPQVTRQFLRTLMDDIPGNQWWSLDAFIRAIKLKYPDFQRPAGDYDSWFIKSASDGMYMRGFSNWDKVDGALIKYMITGPLYWLGQVELATPSGSDVSAFRVILNIKQQSSGNPLSKSYQLGRLNVSSQGKISIPRYFPRSIRYQVARFCEWNGEKSDEYYYRVTTQSLRIAKGQGLLASQLLSMLAKSSSTEISPVFVKALKQWETKGTEAWMENKTILKVTRPEILDEVYKSKAVRFLGEILGPLTVVIKPGAQEKVLAAIAELGLLAENLTITSKKEENQKLGGNKRQ